MARKTVRIEIPPRNIGKYIKLIEGIWARHILIGASSPLLNDPVIDMADYQAKMTQALALRQEALELHERAESLMQQSRQLLGTDVGQSINTKGTLYYTIDLIKRALQNRYMGHEEALSEFGFNVVIRFAKARIFKKKEAK